MCGIALYAWLLIVTQDAPRSVRIFGDPQMIPQMASKEIHPQSTSVLVEPCGSQNLICGSYVRLQQLRSSSVFPVYLAIGRVAVDNEIAAGAWADLNIQKLFGRVVFGWQSLFSLFRILDWATANGTRRQCPCLNGLPALAIGFCKRL